MHYIKKHYGQIGFGGLVLIPILIWFLAMPWPSRFGNIYLISTSFGQIAGLAGMTMFSLALILSARFRFLEGYFGGLDKMYKLHRIYGGVGFILILLHPLLVMLAYFQFSLKLAALFLLPGQDLIIDLGIYSLLLIMLLIILTLYVKLRYEVWKFSHKFLGLAFFLAGLHVFLYPAMYRGSCHYAFIF